MTEVASDGIPSSTALEAIDDLPAILGRNLRGCAPGKGCRSSVWPSWPESAAPCSAKSRRARAPTINLLWKISTALGVPFATLLDNQKVHGPVVLRRQDAKILASRDGKFVSRALFPFDGERKVEFYELRIAAQHTEHAEAHAAGTIENLVVVQGAVEIRLGREAACLLEEGDAMVFEADATPLPEPEGA